MLRRISTEDSLIMADHPADPAPLQVIFDTILASLCVLITRSSTDGSIRSLRNAYVHVLHNYAILNKEAAGIVRLEPSFAPIIWYERIRMGRLFIPIDDSLPVKPLSFFLEGLPKPTGSRPCALFGAPVALQLPPRTCKKLTVNDVLDERSKAHTKIDEMTDENRLKGLAEQLDNLPDLDSKVPQRVRMYVSRMRSVCQGVKESRPRSEFTQCRNDQCQRFFYAGSNADEIRSCYKYGVTPVEMLDVPSMDPSGSDLHANAYWEAIGGIPWYKDPLKRFCTSACCIQWRRQVDRCFPVDVEFDAEESVKRVGIGRVSKAFDAALKRNARFGSQLKSKQLRRARRKAKAVVKDVLKGELSSRVDLMNIDLGLLYWADLMTGCPENIYGRDLPGDRPGWRGDGIHKKTVRTIALIYAETMPLEQASEKRLICDMLKLNRFLSTIKTRAARLL